MKFWDCAVLHVACGGLVLFVSALGEPVAIGQQSGEKQVQEQQPGGSTGIGSSQAPAALEEAALAELPESPGAVRVKEEKEQQTSPQQTNTGPPSQPSLPIPQAESPQSPNSQSVSSQSVSSQSPEVAPQRPVGTAAAESSKASGVAASQPAGVAIAPAKQRRVRSIVIKVGAIVGAGVALGTAVALSEATSSKPPGAH